MTSAHRFYLAQERGEGEAEAPQEVVELMLMEQFHWTQKRIDEIPMRRLKALFLVMKQRRVTSEQFHDGQQELGKNAEKKPMRRRRKA